MEFLTFHIDIDEKDIKPFELIEKYKAMVADELKSYLSGSQRISSCTFCRSSDLSNSFSVSDFVYLECLKCGSQQLTEEVSFNQLKLFYEKSQARKFWLNTLMAQTANVRKKKVVSPLVDWIDEVLAVHALGDRKGAEFYASHWSIAEEMSSRDEVILELVEPFFDRTMLNQRGLKLRYATYSESETYDFIILNDAIGRSELPAILMRNAWEKLNKDGLLFLTSMLSSGFDVLTLGAHHDGLVPSERVYFPTLQGLKSLCENSGFDIIEMSTPGMLDVQNVINTKVRKNLTFPKVVEAMIQKKNDVEGSDLLQTYLQQSYLSSFGRLVLRKKT